MISDQYRLELTPHSLKIQPHYYLLKRDFKWYVAILLSAILCLPFAEKYLAEPGLVLVLSIGMLMLYFLIRDYFFKVNVCYIFDRSTRCIYKTNTPFVNKKPIIRFDEMTIFTNSESGSWQYAMGIRQKQFLKSYCISEPFGSGEKSAKRQEEYEQQILSKIEEMASQTAVRTS